MKKVILNAEIVDLSGVVLATQTGKILTDETGKYVTDVNGQPVRETKPILFGKIILDSLLRVTTKTDDEAKSKFVLASKLNDNLKLSAPTEMELSDEDFEFATTVISRQPLIIKARFLEMVELSNQ